MPFYCLKIWQRRLHGLYRARRRYGRGRFASLIPVWLAPDIPFTRPWAAMPPTAAPPTGLHSISIPLGAIRTPMKTRSSCSTEWFQFHKGAIRTLARKYSFCSYEKSTNFSYVKFSFTYRSVLLSIDSFHQFIWCKYLHL